MTDPVVTDGEGAGPLLCLNSRFRVVALQVVRCGMWFDTSMNVVLQIYTSIKLRRGSSVCLSAEDFFSSKYFSIQSGSSLCRIITHAKLCFSYQGTGNSYVRTVLSLHIQHLQSVLWSERAFLFHGELI